MNDTFVCLNCGEFFDERPFENECPVCFESVIVSEYSYDTSIGEYDD
jgi:Zn finger protein HypA/HybF involved in hydrogenase expression